MAGPRIRLTDPALFGKDAAEDEDDDVFNNYALERAETADFYREDLRVLVVRAYKGEGKSALLRLVAQRVAAGDDMPIVLRATGPGLAPSLGAELDHDAWVRGWKDSVLRFVAVELGALIGVPLTGTALALREEADRSGFRSQSLVAALLSRANVTVDTKGVRVSLASRGIADPERTLRHWLAGKSPVWIVVDDIDLNFESTKAFRLKVASFFTAVRQVSNSVPELRFRLAVRPNVWAILKREFEALSHVEGYMRDLAWSEEQMRGLLAKRVEGYLKRTDQLKDVWRGLPSDPRERDKALIGLAFAAAMPWGDGMRPPHVVLYTLSKHRPRWMVELARVAAGRAERRASPCIEFADINNELAEFGRRRIDDTVAEFKSQCPEIAELLAGFARQPNRLRTDALISVIQKRVLNQVTPKISGVPGDPRPLDVAHFLFQIGFFYARVDRADGSYEHLVFAQRPGLLKDRTNVDDGVSWEIHPVFRQALDLYDPDRGPRRK